MLAEQESAWRGALQLGFERRQQRTVLSRRAHSGPLVVQRALYPEKEVCHTYLVHPPGGVVGGDQLSVDVAVDEGAAVLLTTPGATKFYRSAARQAHLQQHFIVQEGASLEWLPQENIFFPGAIASMDTRIELAGDAQLFYWEIHCFGRPVNQIPFSFGRVENRFELRRDGVPQLIEKLSVDEECHRYPSILSDFPVSATLLISGVDHKMVEAARALITPQSDHHCGVTRIDDLMVVRYLGRTTEVARNCFVEIWMTLRQAVTGRAPVAPRIWET